MTTNEETYGPDWAPTYDSVFPPGREAEEAAASLATYAHRGGADAPVALELGIGTGRIAIPLARRGIRVHGIDREPAMLKVLQSKPTMEKRGGQLTAAIGDMTDATTFAAPDGRTKYDLVYCVFFTLAALPDGASQRRCLAAAASALAENGRLVLEMAVPRLNSFASKRTHLQYLGRRDDGIWLETSRLDPVHQVISIDSVLLSPTAGVRIQPVHHRYTWPSELDLMAELAGLRLAGRCDGWTNAPFGPATGVYVAEYVAA